MLHSEAHGSLCVQISVGLLPFTTEETNLTLYGVVSSLDCLSDGLCCCIAMYFKGSREERWEAVVGIKPYERSGSFWKYESVTFQCFSAHYMDKKH